MARKRKPKYDPYAEFKSMSKEDQKKQILSIAERCIDGAPVSLARRIEIYFDAPAEPKQRRTKEGKMAFAKAWDAGDASEENINRILAERFDGAPGWETY